MSVGTFDPAAQASPPDFELVGQLIAEVGDFESEISLSADAVQRYAPLATANSWLDLVQDTEDGQLEQLIRIFTLGEMQFSSWAAGDKSPVVGLVKLLKKRGTYNSDLTGWIKAHTSNRFLPHGNLMDRL